jgi:metallo-beta-lactamase class B
MIKQIIWTIVIVLIELSQLSAQIDNTLIVDDDIQLRHLKDSIYVHVTWNRFNNYRFSSNGLIVIKDGQALMVDTPMNNEQTEKLAHFIQDSLNAKLTKLIVGHFHDDCIGGLDYLHNIGVQSISNLKTINKCKEMGLPVPTKSFTDSLTLDFNGEQIDCHFFGAGHSFDNIIVWMPTKKILFGGCLVKSINSKGLGNLSDAVVSDWDLTIKKIMVRYPDIKTVIPGHGNYSGSELLSHTIDLVERERVKETRTYNKR